MVRTALVAVFGLTACYKPPSIAPPTLGEVRQWSRPKLPDAGAPASWRLDVEAAIAYAKTHSPAATERDDLEAVADARIDAAGQLTNPELRIGRTFDTELGAVDRTVVGVRFHPDMPWERSSNVAAARADAKAVHARSSVIERELVGKIRRGYATLAFREAIHDALTQEITHLTDRNRLLAGQVARAAATQFDALLADEDLLDLERTSSALEVEISQTRDELGAQLGIPAGQTWQPVWDLAALQAVEVTFDRDVLMARALAAQPELAELGHRAQGADARAYRERTKRIPWIDTLQIERSVRRTAEWAAFVQITLPVFSQNGGAIEVADAEVRATDRERQRIAARTVQRVDAAIAHARATGLRAKRMAERMALIDKAVGELMTQAAAAPVDPMKLLLLDERHGRARRDALTAGLDHRLALIALAVVTGGP